MIDTHSHLNFKAFEDDWEKVVDRAVDGGVEKMIVVGTDVETSKKALQMTKDHSALYAAVGIHPHHAKGVRSQKLEVRSQIEKLEELLIEPKVVAVGEIGLDYHVYSNSKKYDRLDISGELVDLQKKLFIDQVKLANKYNKPVIVHSRSAKDEVLQEVKAQMSKLKTNIPGVFHCFEGSKKYARKILEAGFYISFTGNLTYEQGRDLVSLEVPMDKLLLETDCPYMTPSPLREKKSPDGRIWRNEPINVKMTAQKHSQLRGVDFDEVVAQTTNNARQLFGI